MASTHGGYRRPGSPAPVSGPGSLSKRTDGGPADKQVMSAATGMAYGDNQALMNQERVAPMAGTPNTPPMNVAPSPGAPAGPTYSGVPFGAPSQRPNEPITTGVDIGPGPGSEILPMQHQPTYQAQGPMTQMLAQLASRDQSGTLAQLYQSALASGA